MESRPKGHTTFWKHLKSLEKSEGLIDTETVASRILAEVGHRYITMSQFVAPAESG